MISLLTAFQFLTTFPAVIRRSFTAVELGRAVAFFPLVGLALGGVFYGLVSGLRLIFPLPVVAVLSWLPGCSLPVRCTSTVSSTPATACSAASPPSDGWRSCATLG
jgi:hypothetical protein